MAELRDEKLDLWIHNSWNVLLEGRHGVGKTERIKQAFTRNNLRWKYFSGGTMDPWVDFIGIPKVIKEPDGKEYLTLVLPKEFQCDEVEALFVDEFNRAPPKVQNACMELIQFKSINGRKFRNLKMVWVAVNPDYEDEYNVEKLDQAIRDRFIIQFEVDNEPCPEYFFKKYPQHAKPALAWWHELPSTEKPKVSPRRLEDALLVHEGYGDLRDCLPRSCNVTKLIQTLKIGSVVDKLTSLFESQNREEARRFLAVENNFAQAKKYLLNANEKLLPGLLPGDDLPNAAYAINNLLQWQEFFIPLLPPEKISCLISESQTICKLVCTNANLEPVYTQAMHEILQANTNRKLVKEIKKHLKGTNVLIAQYGNLIENNDFTQSFYKPGMPNSNWDAQLAIWKATEIEKTPQRIELFKQIRDNMPEKLTVQQAHDTLHLLTMIVTRCWPGKLHDLSGLMGLINHCIMSIAVEAHLDWHEMLKVYGPVLGELLPRLEKAGLHKKVMCPMTRVIGIGELVLERKTQELLAQ